MTDNNPVLIQSKVNKGSNRNINNEEELLKINSNNYNLSGNIINKKNDSYLRESKNQSGIEMPSQNDSKIGLLGRGPNLFQNINNISNQDAQVKKKISQPELPDNNNNNINVNNKISKKMISNNNSSRNEHLDSYSNKSSSMSSKRSNKSGSQKIEKVKTFAEDLKYKNLKDEERDNINNSLKKKKSIQQDLMNDKDMDEDEEDLNFENINLEKKDHRRLTKREKIVKLV